jgi:LysR family nitrogen assimilation transcriptional regulator
MPPSRPQTSSQQLDKASVDLRRLRDFVAVRDCGGFSRASAAIGIAQPALTRQIQLLEEEVGQPLLERTGRGARPSEPGRFLLARSRGHLEGLDEALKELRAAFAPDGGHLTLGVCPSIAPFFLDDLVDRLARWRPKLALSIINAYSGDLKSLMQADRIDVAPTYSGAAPEGYTGRDLLRERLVLVGAAGALVTAAPRPLAEAGKMKMILPSRIHELRSIIDRVAASRGVSLKPEIELDSLDAVKGLLFEERGDRLTILPFRSVLAEVEAGALSAAEIDDPEMRRTIAMVMPETPRNAEAATQVAAWFVERARALTDCQDAGGLHPLETCNPARGQR